MANSYFSFKQFTVQQDRCAMKVTTDACLFGAWIAAQLQANTPRNIKTVLDIGAGSGLLSLMVAQKNRALIDAVEIDADAAQQANENVAASPWIETINIINADVLQWQPPHQYDCFFSNPPFYENDLRPDKKGKNIAHHDEGLRLADLLRFVSNHLKEDDPAFLLLPFKRMIEAEKMMAENGLHTHQKVLVKQTPKHQPFRVMIKARKSKAVITTESTLTITDGSGGYTPDFIFLLKEYYLYL